VVLIIFTGLIVAHLASFWLFETERARAIERYAAADAAARITEYARNPVDVVGPPSRSSPRARIRWQSVADVGEAPADGSPPSGSFSSELRRLLAENLGADPVVWISTREVRRPQPPPERVAKREPPPGALGPNIEGSSKWVTVALKLPDGRQALAETLLFQPSLQIPGEAWVSLGLLFFVTAIFSIWAVRLAVQPVRMLAGAADRLSRNIEEPPLAEAGAIEIRSAARSFNRMQDRLRRHVNSRALAFASMSHDLRTPLTRMRLRLESLGEEAKARIAEDLDEIEALTTTVLDVTRGLAPDEPLASVDLEALAAKLASEYEGMGHALAVRGRARPIDVRALALRRALVNLIDNAFKYGRDVVLELEDGPHWARLHVLDRGPGIPPAELEKVLYPFYRVEASRNRETGGAGLGLAIAKDIVEGHGGRLEVANRGDGGLRVTLDLPRPR
jgi:protein-histidine pros-kinase